MHSVATDPPRPVQQKPFVPCGRQGLSGVVGPAAQVLTEASTRSGFHSRTPFIEFRMAALGVRLGDLAASVQQAPGTRGCLRF